MPNALAPVRWRPVGGLVDRPLAAETQHQVRVGQGPLGATYRVQQASRDVASVLLASLQRSPRDAISD